MTKAKSPTPSHRTLYIALGGWNYEGYSEPIGVFSTMKKAKEALKKATGYDHKKVLDYNLDESYDIRC